MGSFSPTPFPPARGDGRLLIIAFPSVIGGLALLADAYFSPCQSFGLNEKGVLSRHLHGPPVSRRPVTARSRLPFTVKPSPIFSMLQLARTLKIRFWERRTCRSLRARRSGKRALIKYAYVSPRLLLSFFLPSFHFF